MDTVQKIIEFESGELSMEETVNLFQELINTGVIFSLQGSYQRAAQQLIDAGLVSKPWGTPRQDTPIIECQEAGS